MFLSRLILDPRSRRVRCELAQPYEMHRTLMRAFPGVDIAKGDKAREKYGVLFRADPDDRRRRVIAYVQSVVEPDWSSLAALNDYLLTDADHPNPACKDITKVYQCLKPGQVLSFRLRANPTKRITETVSGDSLPKSKRVELLREEDQIAWLIRKGREREKGKPGGFEILMKDIEGRNGEILQIARVDVIREGKQIGWKTDDTLKRKTTHLAVRYEGLLRVADPGSFRETLARGIGPGKAFGFGLLSVAPVHPPHPKEAP
jgi:CRISPR system Cascade subunit CasE